MLKLGIKPNPVWSCCSCSFTQLCPTLWDLMDCSMPGFPVLHHPSDLAQTHVYWVSDVIQLSRLSSPSPAFNLTQHQGLFQWVGSLHQVVKVLELKFQHQSFQWIFKTGLVLIFISVMFLHAFSNIPKLIKHSNFFTYWLICYKLLLLKILTTVIRMY